MEATDSSAIGRRALLAGAGLAGLASILPEGAAAAGGAAGPHDDDIRRAYAAFQAADWATFRRLLHADVVWHIPRPLPLAGTYRGPDAVVRVLRRLRPQLTLAPVGVLSFQDFGFAVHHLDARPNGQCSGPARDAVLAARFVSRLIFEAVQLDADRAPA